jgi:3-carboxy-cis,cis-muconate cycloisomerase
VTKTGRPLVDLLAEDKEIAKSATRAQLDELTDPANYLGLAGEMVDRVLALEAKAKRAS